jgi:hypothetical protein
MARLCSKERTVLSPMKYVLTQSSLECLMLGFTIEMVGCNSRRISSFQDSARR